MIEIEIDGQKISAPEGDTIIEVADEYGIYIPRFCYHKKLSVAANCRMCLVEVEKSKKPLPACATPVTEGMKIFTKSQLALKAQRDVMSFLLINHPLDCPVCDQGGECDLQDLALGYGRANSDYDGNKRSVLGPNLGPLIQTFMTRCIQCTRCVRFGEEVAGMRELGVVDRSEDEAITVAVENMMESEVSGNVIDICPVGALTTKPEHFAGRSWSYHEHPMIAPHDCIGSNIFMHSLRNDNADSRRVMRVVPRESEAINECWIADRDRFGYLGLTHEERVTQPMLKRKGQWQAVSWEWILAEVADRLGALVGSEQAEHIGALIGASATLEEQYLFQKLCRSLGVRNIDSRLREQDFSDQATRSLYPKLGMPLSDMDDLDALIVLGGDLRREQPVLTCRLNKLQDGDCHIYMINSYDAESTFPVTGQSIVPRDELALTIVSLLAAIKRAHGESLDGAWQSVTILPEHEAWAKTLVGAEKVAVVMGEQVCELRNAAQVRAWAGELAGALGGCVGEFSHGANMAGAWLAGCVPHRGPGGVMISDIGRDAMSILTGEQLQAYLLFQVEPEHDAAFPAQAIKNLAAAEMVVVMTSFVTDEMREYADFILPVAPFSETSGTYVNVTGEQQSFAAVTTPGGDAKPGWKVLRVLGNFCELDGFEQRTVESVRGELQEIVDKQATVPAVASPSLGDLSTSVGEMIRIAPYPTVCSDALSRRSQPLRDTLDGAMSCVAINSVEAGKLKLIEGDRVCVRQGDSDIELTLRVDDRLADRVVYLPSGLAETVGFGQIESSIILEKANG